MTKKTRPDNPQQTCRRVAYNPITRRWEQVFAEDEVIGSKTITEYWSGALERWVTIPEDEGEEA
jgi:hypothetical protein